MGSLADMISFMDSGLGTTKRIYEKLNEIENEYNSNFNNVIKIRNREIEFLQKEFFNNREDFPDEIGKYYDKAIPEQTKLFDKQLMELQAKKETMEQELQTAKSLKKENFTELRKTNKDLDRSEEKLKRKIAELDDEIAQYNATIDELNSGFGIISNIFKMKKIEKKKNEIIEKRDHLISTIEGIRNKWIKMEEKLDKADDTIQKDWSDIQTDYSVLAEKIENLIINREKFIEKAAFNDALKQLQGNEKFIIKEIDAEKPEKCERCKNKNKSNLFYCNYCGEPFSQDRKDILGSLVETGELNRIFDSLQEGIKGAVSILALIKGLRDGMKTFKKSLSDVKNTESKYSQLPTLKIEVPVVSRKFLEELMEFEKSIDIKEHSSHPSDFVYKTKEETEKYFTDKHIEKFFKAMGDELNKTTKEQW